METPADPMAGFLPPITESGYEVGWVCFSVEPEAGLPTGSQISNQAFVEFDWAGDLLDHPAPKEGPFVNTIDSASPSSQVKTLPASQTSASFTVEWEGNDGGGSGIRDYTIYVSDNSSSFVPWLEDTTLTSDTFIGQLDHTYKFYSIAKDNVVNAENPPPEADATTTVSASSGGNGGGGGGGSGGGGDSTTPSGPELEVNMMGRVASGSMTEDGELQDTINVTSRDGAVTLRLPKGIVALDSEGNCLEEITVDRLSEWPEPQESAYIIGPAYDFGPDGATFDGSIELTISYDPEELPEAVNEEDLVIAYYHSDSGEWRTLEPSVVDTAAHTITASISHFTVFTVIAREVPAFAFANLSISPGTVDSGESVTISIEVSNSGGMGGSYTVTLLINGVEEATQEVALEPRSSDSVTFTVTREKAGMYEVTLAGLSGSFTVKADQFPWWTVGLGGGLVALLLAAITVYLLIGWRRGRLPWYLWQRWHERKRW